MDLLVKQARGSEVKARVEALSKGDVPRQLLCKTARLALRVGAPMQAAHLLFPVVRGSAMLPPSADDKEKIEYALALIRLGARPEGMALLSKLSPKSNPEVLLFQAFGFFSGWDYAAAIPLLKEYLQSTSLSPYQCRIGQTNLAASLVHERRHQEAEGVLSSLLIDKVDEERFLHGFVLHLACENAIYQSKWKEAESFLKRARECLKHSDKLMVFFLKKWQVVLDCLRERSSPKQIAAVLELRTEAERLKHWESIRDCDRLLALVQENQELFLKVYFGSPYESFRKQMLVDGAFPDKLPESYLWTPGDETGTVIDSSAGAVVGSKSGLRMGRLPHRLFSVICGDLYRPFSIGAIHSELYPRTHFDPESSPAKIHVVKTTLRAWFKNNRIPLEISSMRGFLHLKAMGPVSVRLYERQNTDRKSLLLQKIKEQFRAQSFSARAVTNVVDLSKRSVIRLLSDAKSEGLVTEFGRGKLRRYLFAA